MAQVVDEDARRAALEAAERRALLLFDAIEEEGLIAAGRGEREIEADIYELALRRFGVEKHWHRRIVRAGLNTLTTAAANPPERRIETDDLVYVDLGPVFETWEADIGRTYVLGEDADKKRLVGDLERVFKRVQQHYQALRDTITGAKLYAFAKRAAKDAGWTFGGEIAGHIVSEFPHAAIPGKALNRICPANRKRMGEPDSSGRPRHWILEIHLVDRAHSFGGFYERLL